MNQLADTIIVLPYLEGRSKRCLDGMLITSAACYDKYHTVLQYSQSYTVATVESLTLVQIPSEIMLMYAPDMCLLFPCVVS